MIPNTHTRKQDAACRGVSAPRHYPEPLPCPFCGGVPRVVSDGPVAFVECQRTDCPANPSVTSAHIPDAIRQWNQRKGGNAS